MTTLYIAGPMTGQPDMNWDMFEECEEAIKAKGYKAVNPHRINFVDKESMINTHRFHTSAYYLKFDIGELIHCNGIVLLPNHEQSEGASTELFIARRLEMPVYHYDHDTQTFYKEVLTAYENPIKSKEIG
jgi:hypothetical protein